jgi:formate dehydrogenase maturation protein FdhE
VYDPAVADPASRPPSRPRSDTREALELRALKERNPDLGDAVDMHLELLELQRRIQGRIPTPWFELNSEVITRHQREARPLLKFESIPLELSDLRLVVRQTADVLHRHGAIEDADHQKVLALGRDMTLLAVAGEWYRDPTKGDAVMLLAMRPFLARCAEVLQQRTDLDIWTHAHCPLCGGEPDFAVITPAAERHLICSRCTLRWKFEPLTCPYCRNQDRARITSFATPDGQYRVYACDVCQRYLKAYDARRATRPVMPVVDGVATLPLDAAAMQRGYTA